MTTPFMQRLAAFCERLPGAEFYLMHDHPAYRAGKKCFVIVGGSAADRAATPEGAEPTRGPVPPSLSIKVDRMDQGHYCEDPRFTITHYIGQHGWITLDLGPGVNWAELEGLIIQSYRRAAGKRMLAALDASLSPLLAPKKDSPYAPS